VRRGRNVHANSKTLGLLLTERNEWSVMVAPFRTDKTQGGGIQDGDEPLSEKDSGRGSWVVVPLVQRQRNIDEETSDGALVP